MNIAKNKFDKIYIEISNICNLQCDFCPEVNRQKKIMSYELFTKIIDQVKDLTKEVTFHLMGEPLAHPKIKEFVDYCAQAKLPINLTTNGTLLQNKNNIEVLLSPIIRQVNFSLQSLSANFTKKDAEQFLNKIFLFTERAFSERPDLYINYRLWNIGSDEMRNMVTGFRKSHRIKNRLYLHFDSRFNWPSLMSEESSDRGFCYGLKSHFGIHADGTVVPCCLDKEADIALGSVVTHNALEILNNLRACNLREGFARFELREELCRHCSFIRRFDKKMCANRDLISRTL
ncbi:MAG: hypothetical protein A2Z20_01410 [Bdellovibrionales bacterium RBG_16_40_8]|nr:MAG: hypothetical protein A2Z20_01410 [Bdellovibrionales bacterium RBG_16_40_8]